jgi:hypothetical protein
LVEKHFSKHQQDGGAAADCSQPPPPGVSPLSQSITRGLVHAWVMRVSFYSMWPHTLQQVVTPFSTELPLTSVTRAVTCAVVTTGG